MSIKTEIIGNQLVKEISVIINQEMKDSRIGFVTVTAVKLSTDLSYAKVYCTVLEDNKRDATIKVLNGAAGFIRTELCKTVDIRHMPELTFVFDDSIAYGQKIEKIIDDIHKEDD